MRGFLSINLLLFCLMVYSGCAYHEDVVLLRKELISLRDNVAAENMELGRRVKTSEEKLKELDSGLKRKQADLEADQKNLLTEVQSIKGLIEESEIKSKKISPDIEQIRKNLTVIIQSLGDRLTELEKKIYIPSGTNPSKETSTAIQPQQNKQNESASPENKVSSETTVPVEEEKPTDEEVLYSEACKEFFDGEYEKAREKFKEYLELYSSSKNAGTAQYWIGECYYSQKKYEEAIVEFFEVIKKYPKGSKVAAAYLKQGIAFIELGGKENKENAKNSFQKVIKEFPDSIEAKIASDKMAQIK
ncbi:MAG: tol-pal system protein YbgF [Candidatus Schekmanbacteria bacterium RIFCSPHIGHO2_02_FULL_38_11]|uniref:Tol-pal system protein YbgF n=1 Tax=Candidatus Schekmanbacteria bacterium RIFCSPLOWO2_12_FULL_38_15 TaxID=1817883 RepID=A0A1F7SFL9_9BACT|nr:MAG: tol-pal system protein YbgF [Candidatus Schekmanbacteria bacterium GWA2_38_9]OGL48579.1 MAG: tol-pal system protein YbgF [Candidatus Schekmanbacteria bacterium RIFCSPLOWO2_02_FULL_38_14]OGL52559.1 MAG: tol-pal system protein YbgF [Candidatus Schekmanbacteria bacterium RIFCSPLOWO2_12_FULL_38_15]OGL53268.1 MAG: tol-pal system protein YbgF [Candidatus Schekmanbacteria bacterium RIFCSPHIGHO2_02_FULL_38_11]